MAFGDLLAISKQFGWISRDDPEHFKQNTSFLNNCTRYGRDGLEQHTKSSIWNESSVYNVLPILPRGITYISLQ